MLGARMLAGSALALALVGTQGVAAQVPVPTRDAAGHWVLPVVTHGPGRATGSYASGGYAEQIDAACAYYGCDPNYVYNVMMCESGGDPGAIAYNPQSGNYTYGLFQIDGMWGGGGMSDSEQIWFAAEHLTAGDIWWACG
jgi:hypothetical protein